MQRHHLLFPNPPLSPPQNPSKPLNFEQVSELFMFRFLRIVLSVSETLLQLTVICRW